MMISDELPGIQHSGFMWYKTVQIMIKSRTDSDAILTVSSSVVDYNVWRTAWYPALRIQVTQKMVQNIIKRSTDSKLGQILMIS
jgi:hypothetical protein